MANYTYSQRSDVARARAAVGSGTGVGEGPPPGTAPNKLPAPTGLTVSAVTRTTATLTWTAVAGAGSYAVQRKLDGTNRDWATLTARPTAATLRVTGLSAGNAYLFRVQALHATDATRNSDYSAPVSAITPAPVGDTKLPAPTGLAALHITSNSISFTWSATAGAVGYELRYRFASQDNYQSSGRLSASLSASLALQPSTRYRVSIRALAASAANNSQWSEEITVATALIAEAPPANRPPPPSNMRLVTASERSLTLQVDLTPFALRTSRGVRWLYWEEGNQRTARSRTGQATITLTGLKHDTAYKIRAQTLQRIFAPDSVGDSALTAEFTARTTASGTDRAYPRMTATVSVREPNLTAVFSFPGGDNRVVPGARTIITWSLAIGNVTKASGTLTDSTGPAVAGRSFQVRLTRAGITPPTYPYGDYKLNWAYTINGKAGPSGSVDWLLPRRPGTSSIFTGTLTANTRGTDTGYRKGVFGAMSPAGGPITGIYVRQLSGYLRIQWLYINITGTWTSVTIGGKKYLRSEVSANGRAAVYRGGIPTRSNATAPVIVR